MKNKILTIVSWVCLLFVGSTLLWFIIEQIKDVKELIPFLKRAKESLNLKLTNPDVVQNTLEQLKSWVNEYNHMIALDAIRISFCVLSLCACAFLFVYCNPRLFRRSTWTNLSEEWAQNKAEHTARKEAKTQADKQKRIEELQAEIEELKKDDAPPSD